MKAQFLKYELIFKRPVGTSRGAYKTRPVWFLFLEENGKTGIGECAPLSGLSKETPFEVETLLSEICKNPTKFIQNPDLSTQTPSVLFGLETALLDLQNGGNQQLFPSQFSIGKSGIPINGLIWMGEIEYMKSQIQEKLDAGFTCLKLKIGALNFDEELQLLQSIRKDYSADQLTLRVDANGAFAAADASAKLEQLSKINIHSIEQPIAAGNRDEMAELCKESKLPIALDEELIGVISIDEKEQLLNRIKPQFLILKPSLHGGFSGCNEWIEMAEKRNIKWWITSYLESNIGLNAISQWAFTKKAKMHQGLGTGQLFTNNIDSPLEIRGEELWLNPEKDFQIPSFK
jgi:O-succinylbenzoate synthase